jgi:hypothetical protein
LGKQRLIEYVVFVPHRRLANDQCPTCLLDDASFKVMVSI